MAAIRVSRASSGASEYEEYGIKKESIYNRQERDHVIPIYGDFNEFKKMENFLNKEKNYKDNYLHITISYSKNDMKKFESMTESEKAEAKNDIALTIIKHHTSGYDLDSQVTCYAVTHYPKIKQEKNRVTGEIKDRYEHEHIYIALYDKVGDVKLRNTFANSEYMDSVLQSYINNKYGLDNPKIEGERSQDKKYPAKEKSIPQERTREYYKEQLEKITKYDDLINYLDYNKIDYKEVKTTKNNYIKIINKKYGIDDVNLNGDNLKHIEYIVQNKKATAPKELMPKKRLINKYPDKMNKEELETILGGYYKSRIEMIDNRQSRKTKSIIREIYEDDIINNNVNTISMSYQDKLYYKHYKHFVSFDLKGYMVDTKNEKEPKFINKQKDIVVIDSGDIISANKSDKNLEEKVKLMLDIAQAKGWRLSTLVITGDTKFKGEIAKQIKIRLADQRTEETKKTFLKQTASIKNIQKPNSRLEYLAKKIKEKIQADAMPLTEIKIMLSALAVLDHAVKKYKINPKNYEITADNKINNKNNKQKPKNVIDFLQKEINLTSKEAIEECQELYKKQPIEIQTAPIPMPQKAEEPIKIKLKERKKEYEYSKEQRATALHKSTNREARGRERHTANDMRKLSDINLVHFGKKRSDMLLSSDERNNIQQKRETNIGLLPARNRTNQAEYGREQRKRIDMPLTLSISKDENFSASTKWEVVQVSNYSELAALMKEYPYSAANFENGRRSGDKVAGHGNLLIFDIDNDKYDKPLKLVEAKKLLEAHGISAMIIPSQSHNKPKKVASDHQKKYGKARAEEYHTAERYRIIIPTNKPLNNSTNLEIFREFQRLAAKALSLDDFADPKALNDKARFYYKSPIEALPVIIKAEKVLDISNIENKAIENVNQARAEKEAQRIKMEELRANIKSYRVTSIPKTNNLTFADVEKMMDIPIKTLILKFESGEEKIEGSYIYIKTDNTKYSIIDNKLVHDFKNDITYNSITYLQMQYETNNLNKIARELKKLTGEDYIKVNTEAVKTAVTEALSIATNDKTFESHIKKYFGCDYVKLDKDSIKIADREISLKDIDTNRGLVIDALKSNRATTPQKIPEKKPEEPEKKPQKKKKQKSHPEWER